jgi:hypothetical protein
MKIFSINKLNGIKVYIEILHEDDDGFDVNLISVKGNFIQEFPERIPRYLLEDSIRTGSVTETSTPYSLLSDK